MLDTYETERAPHAQALVRKAVRVGWAMTGGQDGAALVRKVALAAVCRMGDVGSRILDEPSPRFTAGPLVAPARRGLTGGLCPQPWVRVDGGRRRLDDVLGDGFAVLTLDAPGTILQDVARQRGLRLIRVATDDSPVMATSGVTVIVDDEGALAGWLASRRVRAVAVRPDRVVATQSRLRDGGGALAAELTNWTWLRTSPATTAHDTTNGAHP